MKKTAGDTFRALAAYSVAAATVVVLGAAPAGAAPAGSHPDPGGDAGVVLELETHPTHRFQNPPGTPTAGTLIGGTGTLTRFVGGEEQSYGFDRWQCLFLEVSPDGSRSVLECTATFDTPDGEITLQGVWTERGGPTLRNEDAVTGGTGKYRRANGYAEYTRLNPEDPANPRYRVRVHLGEGRGLR
ncbi:hypothetical protein ACFXJO_21560 [Streptomyces lavendulae]|uniref:hypothetical protein n=1 Tax=Streptomyces lavendulae TaxID=1914 RepID=UPI00369FF51D